MVGRMRLEDFDAEFGPGTQVDFGSAKRQEGYERARRQKEPHLCDPADVEELCDEIADKWFKRAIRFGDELQYLNLLVAIPDPRTP